MKKRLPLLLGFLAGGFALAEFYIPARGVHTVQSFLLEAGGVLAAAAFVLGGINVIQVNIPVIRKRRQDWQYKLVLILGAVIMLLAGIAWHDMGAQPEPGVVSYDTPGDSTRATVKVTADRDDAEVSIDDRAFEPAPVTRAVDAGAHSVAVRSANAGFEDYRGSVTLLAGQTATVHARLRMLWGISGRVYTWLYDHVFAPCNATMFALLAFFIASAAFRAFRARNVESALLLGSAILIMIGLVPLGRAISSLFPDLAEWIIEIPNNAGRRAIMMGAALGAIATSLRVILGIERSHLGRD
jgi:hypothetical protein